MSSYIINPGVNESTRCNDTGLDGNVSNQFIILICLIVNLHTKCLFSDKLLDVQVISGRLLKAKF